LTSESMRHFLGRAEVWFYDVGGGTAGA